MLPRRQENSKRDKLPRAATTPHAAVGQQYPAVTPAGPLSILRRPSEGIASNLNNIRFGSDDNEAGDCTMQGNVVGNAGGTPNPYSVVQQPTDAVGNLRPTINKIKHLLSGIYQQFFVKPREAYKQWVFLNE